MPSLQKKIVDQRDTLIARGPEIHLHATQVHQRLGHPVVLIPAFLAGMFCAKVTPELLRTLPGLTTRVGHLTEELRKLNAFVRMIAALAPILTRDEQR